MAAVVVGLVGMGIGAAAVWWDRAAPVGVLALVWPCFSFIVVPVSSQEIEGDALFQCSAFGVGLAAGLLMSVMRGRARRRLAIPIGGFVVNAAVMGMGLSELRDADRFRRGSVTVTRIDALQSSLCAVPSSQLPDSLVEAVALLPAWDRAPDAAVDGWGQPFVYERAASAGAPVSIRLSVAPATQVQVPRLKAIVVPADCPHADGVNHGSDQK